MNIGWLGLGRLGLPCALTLAVKGGHNVYGYDPVLGEDTGRIPTPHPEPHVDQMRDLSASQRLSLLPSVGEVVAASDVVFVSVQTPHAPAYDGSLPAPAERRDFDYGVLTQACRDVCRSAGEQQKPITLVVISTALPGTMNRCIRPLLNDYVTLAYNPFFIAMTSTVEDFLHPEFVLLGADKPETADLLHGVYNFHDAPIQHMSITSAELTKVAYNTFISAKIAFANSLMEMCHHTGADVDEVVDGLELATDRVVSSRYMRGGMADGGACHPRDLIAMSWLAERSGLSYDFFESLARGREAQTEWLAKLALEQADLLGHSQVMVLGKSYKPGTPLQQGSPANLLAHYLTEMGAKVRQYDPFVDSHPPADYGLFQRGRNVYVVATRHSEFTEYEFPRGSVVIDPFRYMPEQEGVTLIPLGKRSA